MQRDRAETDLAPDYNVAPTKRIYAVLTRNSGSSEDPAPAGDEPAERQLRVVRWGLVPYWAKDRAIGSRMINARAETVAEKPAFRRAFARRRCLIPADGFYEWQQVTDGDGKRKQPYYIYRTDGGVLAFAGLYELWRDPSVPEDDPSGWLWTATIITTRAEDAVGRIHDRMPMVIETSAWPDWLDPGNTSPADVTPLLVPASSGALASYPVSTAVNNVRNNGPELREPLPGSGAPAPAGARPPDGTSARSGAHPPDGPPAGSGGALF